jgi:hypothetical protein
MTDLDTLDALAARAEKAEAKVGRLWTALNEVLNVNHSPFLGSDGIRPCACVVHRAARAALEERRDER